MSRFESTWSLMKASLKILMEDKKLLLFPLFSGVCCFVVLASFLFPLFKNGYLSIPGKSAVLRFESSLIPVLFLFYFLNYFVIVFFNSAITASVAMRMDGRNPSFGDGIRAALTRIQYIFGWALVSATVGVILRIIEDRSRWSRSLLAGLLGMAWSLVSYLVIPIMVLENKSPMDALKISKDLMGKTWGKQTIGNFSFGLIAFAVAIPGILVVVLAGTLENAASLIVWIGAILAYLAVIVLVQSALQSIFHVVVYKFARDGKVPTGFSSELIRNSIVPA